MLSTSISRDGLVPVYRPNSTSEKTFASGTAGIGFKSGADQIYTLPAIRYRWNFEVWSLVQAAEMGTTLSWQSKGYQANICNEDLTFLVWLIVSRYYEGALFLSKLS